MVKPLWQSPYEWLAGIMMISFRETRQQRWAVSEVLVGGAWLVSWTLSRASNRNTKTTDWSSADPVPFSLFTRLTSIEEVLVKIDDNVAIFKQATVSHIRVLGWGGCFFFEARLFTETLQQANEWNRGKEAVGDCVIAPHKTSTSSLPKLTELLFIFTRLAFKFDHNRRC